MQAWQYKAQEPETNTKSHGNTNKRGDHLTQPRRSPAWTDVWDNRPEIGLFVSQAGDSRPQASSPTGSRATQRRARSRSCTLGMIQIELVRAVCREISDAK